ncbi:MAG: DUF3046 domain-containing protein [Actinobacteria bacterium]|jgi:hypothetical protein|nr:DUF3046 domain-containing protein [Actinomycetota bacterium]
MRITELRARIKDYFPDPETFSQDTVLAELGGISVNQALEIGQEPGDIWRGIVKHHPQMPLKFR